ncbi:MAG: hypothetical protein AB7J40_01235 [Candidatus Altimarinota bacterium]
MMFAILSGILAGAIHAKMTGRQVYAVLDQYLLTYLLPMLFVLVGEQFDTSVVAGNLRVITILSFSMIISLGLAVMIAKYVLDLRTPEMRHGFIVLAVCANTGHGLMLLASGTPDPDVMKLAGGAFYQGFLVVVILPQLITAQRDKLGQSLKTITSMILFHPVSYACVLGFGLAIWAPLSVAYATMLGLRIFVSKKWNKGWVLTDPYPLFAISLTAVAFHFARGEVNPTQWYSLAVTFITAITIGSKMVSQKMQEGHWRIVFAIMVFGIVLAPFGVALPLAWASGCTYSEAYVLAYMVSQPPAYLGMVWLRQGKFGELPVGEWAFSLQAVAAYILAICFPDLLRVLF